MENKNFIQTYHDIEMLRRNTASLVDKILRDFNQRKLPLFDLPAHKRIFLFIFTRALKSYSAIFSLCREGYGQDASMLLRFLLENLITARYILHDLSKADELTKRFVAYKWVIFQKTIREDERKVWKLGEEEQNRFFEKKKMIAQHVEEFKKSYAVESDRGLLTWSGKAIRDMAKAVGRDLLEEYEQTFRLCSRFSHPSILGDQEYMIQDDQRLMFSPSPSEIGIVDNLLKAVKYVLDYLMIVEDLFALGERERIQDLINQHKSLVHKYSAKEFTHPKSLSGKTKNIRESTVAFHVLE